MIDFEELTVGALIASKGVAFRDFELEADDFADACWRKAFEAIDKTFQVKGVVDFFFVLNQISEAPFRQRIASAVDLSFVPGHLPFYVSKVIEGSVDRQLKLIAEKAKEGGDVAERMDTLRASMDKLKLVQAFEMPDLRWDLQLMMANVLNPKQALPSCFAELNRMIVGFKPSGLYVIGARPGVGKTVVGMQLAWEMSRTEDVLFFSLEMDKTDLLKRVVAGELQIDLGLLERGSLTVEQKKKVDALIVEVESKLVIADKGGQTVSQLRSYLIAVKARRDVKMVVVDYLQLITPSNPKAPKYEQISQISMDLKNLAKEFGISILALAQLNRRVDAKADDLPNASDLRDSGQIEQDADVIIMLSRKQSEQDEAKDKLITQGKHADRVSKGFRSLITFDVVKNRHGSTGRFEMRFKGEYSRVVGLN